MFHKFIEIFKYKELYKIPQQFLIKLFSKSLSGSFDTSAINRALIIAPHPDDEVFGCGGLITSLVEKSKDIYILILTKGEASHRRCCHMNEELLKKVRVSLCYKALKNLGLKKDYIYFFSLPDGDLSRTKNDPSIWNDIKFLIKKLNIDSVFCPHPYENSPDHESVTYLVSRAIEHLPLEQYYYCVWTWHHMPPFKIISLYLKYRHSLRLNIKPYVNKKVNAINQYLEPVAPCGRPFSGHIPAILLNVFMCDTEIFFKSK